MAGESRVQNLLWAVRIHRAYSSRRLKARLEAAVHEFLARHETLHSSFFLREGELIAERRLPARPDIQFEDHQGIPAALRGDSAVKFGMMPFHPETGETSRFRLVRTGRRTHILYCAFSHLVIDGVSWPMFYNELCDRLAGVASFADSGLPISERDQSAISAAKVSARNYWQAAIARETSPMRFPGEKIRPSLPSPSADNHSIDLSRTLSDQLAQTATLLGASPFRVAFSAFALWLSRMATKANPRIVTTLTGRRRSEPPVFGTLSHNVFLDVHVFPHMTFADLVSAVGRSLETASAIGIDPIEISADIRDRADFDIFNVFSRASFINMLEASPRHLRRLELGEERIFLPYATRDLAIYFQKTGTTFRLNLCHRRDFLDGDLAVPFLHQLTQILREVCLDPLKKVDAVSILPPGQWHRALNAMVGPKRDYPLSIPLWRLVEEQAERTPDRTAIVCGSRRISFGEVDQKANTVAALLSDAGVGKSSYVPILMHMSAELAVAELAALKLGAVFVPMNPDWPAHRVTKILEALGTELIVSKDSDSDSLPSGAGKLTIPAVEALPLSPSHERQQQFQPDDPVYCIFTSGSTGTPKGALNSSRAVVNRLFHMSDALGAGEGHVVLAAAAPSVDTHVWQLFWPLISGGRTVIATPSLALNPVRTAKTCLQEAVTVMDFVPSVFGKFLDALTTAPELVSSFPDLKAVLIGGDTMVLPHVTTFKSMFSSVQVFNTYGPTECAMSSIWHHVLDTCSAPVPIGRCIANTGAVILLPDGTPALTGQIGELCLRGACVGLGYQNAQGRSGSVFDFSPEPLFGNSMMYRTGDLARLSRDGVIEFHGRIDEQFSVNGLRVEPREIEVALCSHPHITDAAVRLLGQENSTPLLTAFVTLREKAKVTVPELREHLLAKLPRGFIPASFFKVAELPRAASGKLERSRLAASQGVPIETGDGADLPESALTDQISAIWSRVLKSATIDPKSDFFQEHGGDSLAAVIAAMEMEEALGRPVDTGDIYRHQTPASLAEFLDAGSRKPATARDVVASVRAYLSGWKGHQHRPDSMLFTLNETAPGARLFWICQGFREFETIARVLVARHKVTGMRSLAGAAPYDAEAVNALALRYANEIADLEPNRPIAIGAYCQATIILRAVIMQLRRVGREVSLTVFLEDAAFTPCMGKVSLIYAKNSHIHPSRDGVRSKALLKSIYRDGYRIMEVAGNHNTFAEVENAPVLEAAITTLINKAIPP